MIVAQSFTPLPSIPYKDEFDFGNNSTDALALDIAEAAVSGVSVAVVMGGAGNGSSDGINSTIAMATNLTSIVREKVHNPCYDIQHYDMCCSDGEEEMCTPVHMAVAACMMAGILQIVMGFLNFGFVVDYIGFTVLNGESCTRFGRDMSLLTRICLASDYTARAVSIQGSTERACCCYMCTSSLNTACG